LIFASAAGNIFWGADSFFSTISALGGQVRLLPEASRFRCRLCFLVCHLIYFLFPGWPSRFASHREEQGDRFRPRQRILPLAGRRQLICADFSVADFLFVRLGAKFRFSRIEDSLASDLAAGLILSGPASSGAGS
jgi:hypothetical protein